MPYPSRLNPNVDSVRPRVKAWARVLGMLDGHIWDEDGFDGNDYALLAGYAYPDATLSQLELIAQWGVAATYFDDYFLEVYKRPEDLPGGKEYAARLERFLPVYPTIVPLPEDAVERSLADLWPRTVVAMPPMLAGRFREHVVHYFRGNVWELANRAHDWVPDPVEYVEMRRKAFGAEFMADLVEFGLSMMIRPDIYRTWTVTSLVRTHNDWVGLANDVLSYRREADLEGEINNGVLIAEAFLGCPREQAVHVVQRIIRSRLLHFEHVVETEVPVLFEDYLVDAVERDSILAYVQGLRDWMGGVHAWTATAARYRDCTDPGEDSPAPWYGGPTGLGTASVRVGTR